MKVYCVGGAVRDELLGRAVKDRDWVVTGATPEQMAQLGYRPVGRDFPVFLHPDTHEEYALARTERKTARGYRGFQVYSTPEVTLEDDLRRRDLTINAIARASDGTLIDPWGGQADLQARCLRHVSEAFVEDPVRILRLARFAARFPEFSIAPETLALARRMVEAGEVDALVPERVWQELARGLMEPAPSRLFTVLSDCGALERLLPDCSAIDVVRLDAAARCGEALEIRYALAIKGPALRACNERLRVPAACAELASLLAGHGAPALFDGDAAAILERLERIDALRRPDRALALARACAYPANDPAPQCESIAVHEHIARHLIDAARSVDAGAIAATLRAESAVNLAGRIQQALREARRSALAIALETLPTIPSGDRP